MRKLLCLFLLSMLVCGASAQYAPYYKFERTAPFSFEDVRINDGTRVAEKMNNTTGTLFVNKIIVGDTAIAVTYNNSTTVVEGWDIGFDFNLGGSVFNRFALATNGIVYLGTGNSVSAGISAHTDVYNRDVARVANLICTNIADNYYATTGDINAANATHISYKTTGEAGSRILIVQYLNMLLSSKVADGYDTISFQFRLYESDHRVEICYHNMKPEKLTAAKNFYVGLRSINRANSHFRKGSNFDNTNQVLASGSPAVTYGAPAANVPSHSDFKYTFTRPDPCGTPGTPSAITTTVLTSSVSGTFSLENAEGCLVVVSSDLNYDFVPAQGRNYVAGEVLDESKGAYVLTSTFSSKKFTTPATVTLAGDTEHKILVYGQNNKCLTAYSAAATATFRTLPAAPVLSVSSRETNKIRFAETSGINKVIGVCTPRFIKFTDADMELLKEKNNIGDTLKTTGSGNKEANAVVFYKGDANNIVHDNLTEGAYYYYTFWSIDDTDPQNIRYSSSFCSLSSFTLLRVPVRLDMGQLAENGANNNQSAPGFSTNYKPEYIKINSIAATPAFYAFRYYLYAGYGPQDILLPEVQVESAGTYRLFFDFGVISGSMSASAFNFVENRDSVLIQVTTGDPADLENFETVFSITSENQKLPSLDGWEVMMHRYVAPFQVSQAGKLHIRIYSTLVGAAALYTAPTYAGFFLEKVASCDYAYDVEVVSEEEIFTDKAGITWTDNQAGLTRWNVSYKEAGQEWDDAVIERITAKPAYINGLLPQTQYQVRVQAVCSETNTSAWSEASPLFTTKYKLPFSNDFSEWTALGDYWAQANGRLPQDETPIVFATSTAWTVKPWPKDSEKKSVQADFTRNAAKSFLTPAFAVDREEGGTYKFSFDLCYVEATATNDSMSFAVLISSDGGKTFTKNDVVKRWGRYGANSFSELLENEGVTHHEFVLPDLDTIQIAFYVEHYHNSSSATGTKNTLSITNVKAYTSCETPAELVTEGIGIDKATLKWETPVGDAKIRYRVKGEGSYEYDNAENGTYLLSGLTGTTAYEWSVRSICHVGDSSAWAPTVEFTTATPCPVVTEPVVTPGRIDALLKWQSAAASFLVKYKQESAAEWIVLPATADKETLFTELIPETEYAYSIKAQCSQDAGDTSAWTTAQTFTTLARCAVVTGMEAVASRKSATITWESTAASFKVRYKEASTTTWVLLPMTDKKEVVIEELKPETGYEYSIQAQCSDNESDTSLWAEAKTFTTLPPCAVPSNITTGSITTNSFDIHFESDGLGIRVYLLEGSNGEELDFPNASETITIEELNANTLYKYKLRSYCAESDTSAWSLEYEVRTGEVSIGKDGQGIKDSFSVYAANGTIHVRNPNRIVIEKIELFTVGGQKVGEYTVRSEENVTISSPVQSSLVIVRVTIGNGHSAVYKVFLE